MIGKDMVHDWYSLMLTEFCKNKGVDFQQYVLRGQTIFEYPVGPLKMGVTLKCIKIYYIK
jgi:hypothetical protein